jgi:DNA polymerase-3 subunit delta'
MTDLIFSKKNKNDIDNFLSNPSHALLVHGRNNYGKKSTAKYIASSILKLKTVGELLKYPYFYEIFPDNNVIGIDKIRELKSKFQLKTTGKNLFRRVAIIYNADFMNEEAQNALLKVLEEPPEDSVLILTSSNENQLKPTILSRIQKLKITKPSETETKEYFISKGSDEDTINKMYLFADGAIGLLSSLLSEDSNIDIISIDEAKKIIQSSLFEKLIKVDELTKDKDQLYYNLFCMKQIAKSALKQAIIKNQTKLITYWVKVTKRIQATEDMLLKNANTKLMLTSLFLEM